MKVNIELKIDLPTFKLTLTSEVESGGLSDAVETMLEQVEKIDKRVKKLPALLQFVPQKYLPLRHRPLVRQAHLTIRLDVLPVGSKLRMKSLKMQTFLE
mgnify:CR=1 FL=1